MYVPPTPDLLAAELAFAIELADLADSETLHRYEARTFTVDRKPDRSEVTEADRGAEAAIARHLAAHRPHHGLFGEEHGVTGDTASPWRWIVDPVDGTSNFVRGIPVWASLIALTYHGEVVVGVVSAPALAKRWWAGRGHGAFDLTGRRLQVSTFDRLDEAQVCVTFSAGWDAVGRSANLVSLAQAAYRTRGFGDFWQHMLVAEGAIEVAVDAIGLQPYDLAAVQIVVEEAGGTFTDRHGERTYLHDSAIATNGLLHESVIAHLR